MTRIPPAAARLGLAALLAALVVAAPALAQVAPASVDDVQRQVAQVRGLELLEPVPTTTMDRGALQAVLTRDLESDLAIREYRATGILYEALGLVPPGFDPRLFRIRVLREHVGSLYDRAGRRLIVLDENDPPTAFDKLILAYETTHALRDQRAPIARSRPGMASSDDAALAATALVEGDAMLVMNEWGRRFLTPDEKRSLDGPRPSSEALAVAPPIVRAEIEFPYRAGRDFAARLVQVGGQEALDRALAAPPRSTEQILHPDKYLARDAPQSVSVPPLADALGDGWRQLRSGTLGELVLRGLIQDQLGYAEADTAAAGWGGDTYAVLQDASGRRAVVVETAWDTEIDAAEFYNAYTRAVVQRFGSTQRPLVTQPSRNIWFAADRFVEIMKSGDHVRIVFAPDAATLDAIDGQFASRAPVILPTSPPSPAFTPATGAPPAGAPATVPPAPPVPTAPTPATTLPFADDESAPEDPAPSAPVTLPALPLVPAPGPASPSEDRSPAIAPDPDDES